MPPATKRSRNSEQGQALVLVALSMVVLLLMASLAIDMGRFVSERRFLQNDADAAALAGAAEWKRAKAAGQTDLQAEASAKSRALEALHAHFDKDPTATRPPDPADPPIYSAGCSTPSCLIDGILVNPLADPGSVRVALRNDIDFTFGRAAALLGASVDFQTISARARAGRDPNQVGPLPIAVRRYIQPFGPRASVSTPCPAYDDIQPEFTDVFATAATSCIGSVTDSVGRADSSVTLPGEPVEILGLGADPCSSAECGNNPVDFRGFVALDIRNYANAFSQQFYNGVTPSTNAQTLKDMQASYFCSGYPGPPFPDVVTLTPPDPDLQVATLNGNSAGIALDAIDDCYGVGDIVFALVYDGIVKQIPEFAMDWPGSNKIGEIPVLPIGTGSSRSFSVSKNDVFSGTVSFSTVADPNDPNNPLNDGTIAASPPIAYGPNPATPTGGNGVSVTVGPITTASTVSKPAGATPGIYAALIKGTADAYSNQAKYLPLSMNVGGVNTDFEISGPTPQGCTVAAAIGDTISCSFRVSRVGIFPGPVTLTLNNLDGSLRQTMGPPVNNNGSAQVSISTAGMTQGLHTLLVRGTATNLSGQTVTHLYPFVINVAPQSAPGSDTYVDIIGYAVMQITDMTANSVWAKSIAPVLSSTNDPTLQLFQPIRLIPWEYQP